LARAFSAGSLSPAIALAVVGGAAIAASFLDFSLWLVAWLAFVPILVALDAPLRKRRAAGIGFAAGMATNVPAFFWLVHTIHVFGGFPTSVSLGFYLVLSMFGSLEFVVFALLLGEPGSDPLPFVRRSFG
jgi:apolipoprotein N-acyltransferase